MRVGMLLALNVPYRCTVLVLAWTHRPPLSPAFLSQLSSATAQTATSERRHHGFAKSRAENATARRPFTHADRKSTRLNSKSLMRISYAVFCLKKKITAQLVCDV